MSDATSPDDSNPSDDTPPATQHQELQHSQVSARVPEEIGPGTFSTGSIVMHGAHEFVIDFLMSLAPPRRVAARVVLPPSVVPLFIGALQENLNKYVQVFGHPPKLPSPPPGATPPPISDVYDQLKIPETVMSGVYANTVMIVHSPAEFGFDFITSFYPKSAVAARVFLAAPHVPQLLDSLIRSWEQFRTKQQGHPPQRLPEPPPPKSPDSDPTPPV